MPCRFRAFLLLISLFTLIAVCRAQSPPQSPPATQAATPVRDAQAIAALQQAFAAMGGTLPSDSVATGTVTIVEGSRTESGTIRILTRSVDQTIEDIQTPNDRRTVIYSRTKAAETVGGTTKLLRLESSAAKVSPVFPLTIVAWALTSPDAATSYIGQETLNGESLLHIRLWNTFTSPNALGPPGLAPFTARDLWIDAKTGLPRVLAFEWRDAGGSAPRIPVKIEYADYRNINGVIYPFQIHKILNGTPWTTITITNVRVNTGLADTDFSFPAGVNQGDPHA
jgi:hypothetical protein